MTDICLPFDGSAAARSQLADFARRVSEASGRDLNDYAALHRWACDQPSRFYDALWSWAALPYSGSPVPSVVGDGVDSARFFPGVRLNYAQCLLRGGEGDATAVIVRGESGSRSEISRADLTRAALSVAAALRSRGVGPGDRVAAVVRNSVEAIETCIGAAAIGATWGSVGLDLGVDAVVDRFAPLEPTVLVAHGLSVRHGVPQPIEARVQSLVERLPSLRTLVLLDGEPARCLRQGLEVVTYDAWTRAEPLPIDALPLLPFDHPLFVLFSSGTTGPPKCLVHGAGGTLLEHVKEHRLHTDLRTGERLYFHTSCGWMMWNWQLSALASGVTLVVYDGSPSWPDGGVLLRMLDQEAVAVFGTSPAYVDLLQQSAVEPREHGTFASLRAVLSTGSILYESHFDWIVRRFKAVPVQSISGGSDIIGCFVLGNPLRPVYRGDSQSISLGLDVRVHTDRGIESTGEGELVCVNPFPSRPMALWGDPDRARFRDAYFSGAPGVWTHGDRVRITPHGSVRMLGRSDATMNIRGVRIGPAEVYRAVLAIPVVHQAMAIEQRDSAEPGRSRMVLLVVLAPGISLERALVWRIKREIEQKASAVHVPAVVAQVSDLPQTLSGKYSERAARDVLNGLPSRNRHALRNPETLDELRRHPDLQPRP